MNIAPADVRGDVGLKNCHRNTSPGGEDGEVCAVGERELRRRCRKLLNELDIRPPLDVHELCRRVGEQRGKPIRPVAHPIPVPGPFGAWITTDVGRLHPVPAGDVQGPPGPHHPARARPHPGRPPQRRGGRRAARPALPGRGAGPAARAVPGPRAGRGPPRAAPHLVRLRPGTRGGDGGHDHPRVGLGARLGRPARATPPTPRPSGWAPRSPTGWAGCDLHRLRHRPRDRLVRRARLDALPGRPLAG